MMSYPTLVFVTADWKCLCTRPPHKAKGENSRGETTGRNIYEKLDYGKLGDVMLLCQVFQEDDKGDEVWRVHRSRREEEKIKGFHTEHGTQN